MRQIPFVYLIPTTAGSGMETQMCNRTLDRKRQSCLRKPSASAMAPGPVPMRLCQMHSSTSPPSARLLRLGLRLSNSIPRALSKRSLRRTVPSSSHPGRSIPKLTHIGIVVIGTFVGSSRGGRESGRGVRGGSRWDGCRRKTPKIRESDFVVAKGITSTHNCRCTPTGIQPFLCPCRPSWHLCRCSARHC
jgi:hypothetical protein